MEKEETEAVAEETSETNPQADVETSTESDRPQSAQQQEDEFRPPKGEISLIAVDNGYVATFVTPTMTGQTNLSQVVMLDKEAAKFQLLHFVDELISKIIDRPEVSK